MPTLEETISKSDAMLAAIKGYPDPRRASAEWKQLYNLLKGTAAAGNHLDNAIARRDVEDVTAIVDSLRGGGADVKAESTIDDATLKIAIKAFKKRLKVVMLDDASRIDSRNPMSKGEGSNIAAIEPPREFAKEVWDELIRRGVLKSAGQGTCQFVREL